MDELRAAVSPDLTYQIEVEGTRPLEVSLLAIDGVKAAQLVEGNGESCSIELVMERRSPALAAVIRAVVHSGGEIVACTRAELTLDQIFRDVVRAGVEEVSLSA
jgi:hypothetical protein